MPSGKINDFNLNGVFGMDSRTYSGRFPIVLMPASDPLKRGSECLESEALSSGVVRNHRCQLADLRLQFPQAGDPRFLQDVGARAAVAPFSPLASPKPFLRLQENTVPTVAGLLFAEID